jgi:hypothetical protein
MTFSTLFFREHSLSKVAAVFPHAAAAEIAAREVKGLANMQERQVQVIEPFDHEWGRKVEPEGVGIWRTAIRAHVTCGLLGMAAGLAMFAAFYLFGTQAVVASPGLSLMAMVLFMTMFGLMVGGALTVRPDHDSVVSTVRQAVADGLWSVVVHPISRNQLMAAKQSLAMSGAQVARSL